VGGGGARYGARVQDAAELRDRFLLGDRTKPLLVSVATDPELEKYWAHESEHDVPSQLSALEPWAMTTPNFSFFDQVPRPHILHNRARIVSSALALSAGGVASILHVNAQTPADWRFWAELLRNQPHVRFVAKEFQTGTRNDWRRANEMIDGLRSVRDAIGRELHPIIVGGTQYAPHITKHFSAATFVDSRPFMCTMKRRRLELNWPLVRWVENPTPEGAALDDLLEHNIRAYTRYVERLRVIAIDDPKDAAITAASIEEDDELLTNCEA
jgi:hypothetical protein